MIRVLCAGLVVVALAGCTSTPGGSAGELSAPSTSPSTTSTTTTTTTSTTTTTTTTPPMTLDEVVGATIADLEAFWARELPAATGVAYAPVAIAEGYDLGAGDEPMCGTEALTPEVASDNAFYCAEDDRVAWDEAGLFPTLDREYGPFAVSLVLAHEWGHALQSRLGVPTSLPTIVRELQADCLAGVWTGEALAGGGRVVVEPSDLDLATAGFLLFRDPTGTSAAQPGAHGNAFDRVGAFLDGVRGGTASCVTYAEEFPPITQRPFLSAEDAARGGDVPFDEVLPLLAPTLEVFWAETMASLELAWVPVTAVVEYQDGGPTCAVPVTDPGSVAAGVAHCPADGSVHVDLDGVLADLYDSFGDFSPAFVLGLGWSQRVQESLGLTADTRAGRLQADCLTGAWTGAVATGVTTGTDAEGNPVGGTLSPGDLDEAIQAILVLGDLRSDTGAFERVESFRNGYLGGVEACLGA